MTFEEVVFECIENKELVREFNRLSGTCINIDNRSPIHLMIDKATGYQKEIDKKGDKELRQFFAFVFNCIYLPLAIGENR